MASSKWKGDARYFNVVADGARGERAAWSYPDPATPFAILRDHVAFCVGAMYACLIEDERVVPQPGGFKTSGPDQRWRDRLREVGQPNMVKRDAMPGSSTQFGSDT